ncbi:PepSY domain-containing protein [Porticoccus sp. W117]|uniref:PepSY domain-containing protein n=1 Tax=Porticoccus sp. W117 TaxID=3054777 RepID=UPI0025960100|nr:PepSY domain-containing protein [Porticoccus sp. W117]MDM3870391.1 PepSY domain-containing protein [Porticoccus sp. W117]
MKNTLKALPLLMAATFTGHAFAGADCPELPKEQWMTPLEMQKKIVNEYGFEIKKFKVDGNCYEIYGWEMIDGKRTKVEVYFNPKTGEIVKKEVD